MLITICVPNRNRTHDLRAIMPKLVEAMKASPPVEISLVDYNSSDDCQSYCRWLMTDPELDGGFTYRCYSKRPYYHPAHARNLSVLAAHGEYVIISGTDIFFYPGYFPQVRKLIKEGYTFIHPTNRMMEVMCVLKSEVIAAGGFDERFEFYGPECKELEARLRRRGLKEAFISDKLLDLIETPNPMKLKNYRLPLTKRDMWLRGKKILEENNANHLLVANVGKEWGAWK